MSARAVQLLRNVIPSLASLFSFYPYTRSSQPCSTVRPRRQISLPARVDIFRITDGLVHHESSRYGDGWLRQRLGDHADWLPPTALPVTPPVTGTGRRFR
jgi:hypothetical protein